MPPIYRPLFTIFQLCNRTLSVITMAKKTEKKGIAILSLILSSSFFIFWIIAIILLFTGQISFAP
ncbi:hypothetical protein BM74_16515 [Bacillus thuringiensis]|uniref:Uncharacterized protein n=1 Tax=Bacillus thuringiensis TaxID=1428 RepID=A0A437SHE4_BACTU|nr:hypothetical protein BM74_16515 [Bacillus thuringiensis]